MTVQITDSRTTVGVEPTRDEVDIMMYRDFRTVDSLGNWQANAEDLITAIQASAAVIKGTSCVGICIFLTNCSILGAARISVPGTRGFNRPFAVQELGTDRPKCSVAFLAIPFDNILSLDIKLVRISVLDRLLTS